MSHLQFSYPKTGTEKHAGEPEEHLKRHYQQAFDRIEKNSEVTKKTKLQKEKGQSTRKGSATITKEDFTKFFVSGTGSGGSASGSNRCGGGSGRRNSLFLIPGLKYVDGTAYRCNHCACVDQGCVKFSAAQPNA